MVDKIAFIIPCYNEEKSVAKVVTDAREYLPEADVIVIDNNSSDNTFQIAQENGAKVHLFPIQGKANAIRFALRKFDYDVYIMVDGDDTYDISEIRKMVDLVLNGPYDHVVGNRFIIGGYQKENKRNFHNFGNQLVKNLINIFFKGNLQDIMSGLRVFNKPFAKTMTIEENGFELETEMAIHSLDKKFATLEYPINYKHRSEDNPSKLNTFVDGFRILKKIFLVIKNFNPLLFYSTFSMCFLLVSVFLMYLPFYEYITVEYVTTVPRLIVGGIFFLASFISITIGLTLDTIKSYHAADVEGKIRSYY